MLGQLFEFANSNLQTCDSEGVKGWAKGRLGLKFSLQISVLQAMFLLLKNENLSNFQTGNLQIDFCTLIQL